jgi:hypothetical protein
MSKKNPATTANQDYYKVGGSSTHPNGHELELRKRQVQQQEANTAPKSAMTNASSAKPRGKVPGKRA